jgi:hypothetical protein
MPKTTKKKAQRRSALKTVIDEVTIQEALEELKEMLTKGGSSTLQQSRRSRTFRTERSTDGIMGARRTLRRHRRRGRNCPRRWRRFLCNGASSLLSLRLVKIKR